MWPTARALFPCYAITSKQQAKYVNEDIDPKQGRWVDNCTYYANLSLNSDSPRVNNATAITTHPIFSDDKTQTWLKKRRKVV